MKRNIFKALALSAVCLVSTSVLMNAQQLNPAVYGPQVNKLKKGQGTVTDYVPNQVIVKFKDTSGVRVQFGSNRTIRTTSVKSVDSKLTALGIKKAEQLMPLTGAKKLRKSNVMLKSYSGREIPEPDMSRLYLMNVDSTKNMSVYEVIKQLENIAEVEYAEPNYRIYAMTTSESATYTAEPLYTQQWGPSAINLPALWDMPKINDKRPVIAIIDTGVEVTHPDLADNIYTNEKELNGEDYLDDDNNGFYDDVHGWDFIKNRPVESDPNGHGTHCAGIAAAVGNNGKGITGANPDALILPVTVLGADGSGDIASAIKGVDYAVANGADVLSMSFGSAWGNSMYGACKKAFQSAVLVAAAGNDGLSINVVPRSPSDPSGRIFPGAFDVVLGVMASDNNGNRAGFSNYDEDGAYYSDYDKHGDNFYNYEVLAPGVDIMSTYPGGQYKSLNGTSMATPLVAGAVSRLLQTKETELYRGTFVGDIVHATDNATGVLDVIKAYNFNSENRSTELVVQSVAFDDSAMGDGDGVLESGEIVDLYPTIRCLWGNANNIKLNISVDTEYEKESTIEIIDTNVDFGWNLNSQGSGKSKNPLRVKINENIVNGYNLRLIVSISDESNLNVQQKQVEKIIQRSDALTGAISEDLTLTPDKQYIINGNFGVPSGVTLTILPGTILKFTDGAEMKVEGEIICNGTPENPIIFCGDGYSYMGGFNFGHHNEISYVIFENLNANILFSDGNIKHCIIKNTKATAFSNHYPGFVKCNIYNNEYIYSFWSGMGLTIDGINMIGNICCDQPALGTENVINSNIFTNYSFGMLDTRVLNNVLYDISSMVNYKPSRPNYFGTSREDYARIGILDSKNPISPRGWGTYDLSNMPTRPIAEAHGIVWKVVVNGYDAQDEFDLLPPLGVGKHKFEVYFNRPMNKSVTPTVAMGAVGPYDQIPIDEEGCWNEDGTIYTAYITIDGKFGSNGLNRIYVAGAEDDEYFEIPIEDSRFNVMVQVTGSLATHFFAEAGLGKVNLTWETDEEDFEDLLGYNIMRYTEHVDSIYETDYNKYGDWNQHLIIKGDTTIINETLIDSRIESFTDYNVIPGTTYYYQIKQLTTSMNSHDLSNVVSATPLTAAKGDANGSMSVDVADVVTEVAYMTGQDPQPFIFEAADVNEDEVVNVLDVVGTVNIIKSPAGTTSMSVNSTAIYTIEDGVLYVESPVALGGVQFRFNVSTDAEITPLEALNDFETVGDNQGENGYLFMAFSMTGRTISAGKQALLRIGSAEMTEIVLCDATGKSIIGIDGNTSGVGAIEAMQMELPYPNPFSDVLTVPYKVGKDGVHDVKIVVSTVTGATVAMHTEKAEYGFHSWTWNAGKDVANGVYLVSLYVDGRLMQTAKAVKR